MKTQLFGTLLSIAMITAGCTSVDKNAAKALSTAGTVATQAISDQSKAAKETIGVLPEWWSVRTALGCSNAKAGPARDQCVTDSRKPTPPAQIADLKKISEVMEKRTLAALTLRSAYQSFGNLADYDASAEVKKSMTNAFASLNSLLEAAQKLSPAASLPPISTTFTSAAGKAAGFFASQYQSQQILAANHDLRVAVDSLASALEVERNHAATKSLLDTLAVEQWSLYSALVQSGLISPQDAMSPLVSVVAPGVAISNKIPPKNDDVILTAATLSFVERIKRQEIATASTYENALAALRALSSQHSRLEENQSIDSSSIIRDAQDILSSISSN